MKVGSKGVPLQLHQLLNHRVVYQRHPVLIAVHNLLQQRVRPRVVY